MVTVGVAMTVKERMTMATKGAAVAAAATAAAGAAATGAAVAIAGAAAAAVIRPASQVVALERRKIQLMMIGGAVDKTKQWLTVSPQ